MLAEEIVKDDLARQLIDQLICALADARADAAARRELLSLALGQLREQDQQLARLREAQRSAWKAA
jgi:hypothetical protein